MELSDAMEKTLATPGIDPGTFRLVAQCLSHATPGPSSALYQSKSLSKLMMIISKTNYAYGNRINATNVMQKWQKKLPEVQ
jgi:hypothetical protein